MRSCLALLLAAACLPAPAAAAEVAETWPCSRPAPVAPNAAWLWKGAKYDATWRDDAEVAALIAEITPRGLPEDQAVARIEAFGKAHPGEGTRYNRLASGLLDSIGREQSQVIAGIRRFNTRQAALAARMEAAYARTATSDPATEAAAAEQLQWDTRIFEDRQRLLPVMCRIPGVLGARLGTLLAATQEASGASGGGVASYLVYATNELAGEISVIDPVTRREIDRIVIGKRPRGLVASPDSRLLYVAVSGSPIAGPGVDETDLPPADKNADGIAVVDLSTRKVLRLLRGVSDPEQVAVSRDGTLLYVASEDTGQLIVMTTEGREIAKLAVGEEPEGVSVSPDGATVLVTSEGDNSVAIIRGGLNPKVEARVAVGERPRTAAFLDNDRAAIPGEFDSTVKLIDLRAAKTIRTVRLGGEDRPMTAVATGGDSVVVTTGRGGNLIRIDLGPSASAKPLTGAVFTGQRPWGLALSPDGKLAFTANGPGNDVSIVDLASMRLVGKVATAGSPWGVLTVPKVR